MLPANLTAGHESTIRSATILQAKRGMEVGTTVSAARIRFTNSGRCALCDGRWWSSAHGSPNINSSTFVYWFWFDFSCVHLLRNVSLMCVIERCREDYYLMIIFHDTCLNSLAAHAQQSNTHRVINLCITSHASGAQIETHHSLWINIAGNHFNTVKEVIYSTVHVRTVHCIVLSQNAINAHNFKRVHICQDTISIG